MNTANRPKTFEMQNFVKPNSLTSVTFQSGLPTCSGERARRSICQQVVLCANKTLSELCPTPAGFLFHTFDTRLFVLLVPPRVVI